MKNALMLMGNALRNIFGQANTRDIAIEIALTNRLFNDMP